MRKIADALLDPKLSHMMLPTGGNIADGDAVGNISMNDGTTGDEVVAGSASVPAPAVAVNTTPALSARQQAALLYALAGDQGDSESLLQLGWMLYYGEQGDFCFILIYFRRLEDLFLLVRKFFCAFSCQYLTVVCDVCFI